jgi:uncharacterized protein YjbI with pentapeptide repeats
MKFNLHLLFLSAGICLTTILAAPMAEKPLASDRYSANVSLSRGCPTGSCDPGSANGTSFNGFTINGTNLNGTNLNGQGLGMNGVSLNGANLNGANLNGANLNGTGWTQLTVTAANLKEMPVQEISLEGGQLVFHLRRVNR